MRTQPHDDRIRERVVALYDQGVSFRQIAEIILGEFGKEMSRSAIAGVTARANHKRGGRPKRGSPRPSLSPLSGDRGRQQAATAAPADPPPALVAAKTSDSERLPPDEKTVKADVAASKIEMDSLPPIEKTVPSYRKAVPRCENDGDLTPKLEAAPARSVMVAPPKSSAPATRSVAVDVTRLKPCDCRYPTDEIDKKGLPFIGFRCAEPAMKNQAWCEAHFRLVYQKPDRRPKPQVWPTKMSGFALRISAGRAA